MPKTGVSPLKRPEPHEVTLSSGRQAGTKAYFVTVSALVRGMFSRRFWRLCGYRDSDCQRENGRNAGRATVASAI